MTAYGDVRHDEFRRAWIAAHQGVSTIQRRRAEVLGRSLRARRRAAADAAPDPHDDTVTPPIWFRSARSAPSHLELIAVTVLVFVAPVGWLGGWILQRAFARMIPVSLRSYPVAALLWSSVIAGLVLVAIYGPSANAWSIVVAPWICLQVAAMPAAAGVYGVLEGWLAVAGSDRWWPLTERQRPITAREARAILGDYEIDLSVDDSTVTR